MPSEFITRQKNDLIRDISAFGSLFSYVLMALIFLALDDIGSFRTFAIGGILIYAATCAIRVIYFKNRPVRFNHRNALERLDASAFPSLHAARTGFMAVFFIRFFDSLAVSVIFAAIGFVILYSRIYLKRHDWKDVSAGAALGIMICLLVQFL